MKITYIHLGNNNSADRVLIRGLRENSVEVEEISDNSPGFKKFAAVRAAFKKAESISPCDSIFVGYTAALFVPWMNLISRKPITYYALATFYESMIISRKVGHPISWKSFKYWVLDYLACRSADHILVESAAQKEFIRKRFGINSSKLIVHRTGVDDTIFYFDPTVKKLDTFTVLFRGKFTPEAGLDVLLRATKKLEDQGRHEIKFRILGHGFLEKEVLAQMDTLQLKNVELITEYLSDTDLRTKMLECHVSLGQLSNHPRLDNTLPFKSFEALSMKFPFITARNKAILEIFDENETCLCFNPGDADDLANKIILAYENPTLLEKISHNGYKMYLKECTPATLAKKVLTVLQ